MEISRRPISSFVVVDFSWRQRNFPPVGISPLTAAGPLYRIFSLIRVFAGEREIPFWPYGERKPNATWFVYGVCVIPLTENEKRNRPLIIGAGNRTGNRRRKREIRVSPYGVVLVR